MSEILEGETVLADDYPVHAGYIYLVDGEPTMSPLSGDVGALKRRLGASEVRRCRLVARKIQGEWA